MYDERLGKLHFWLTTISVQCAVLPAAFLRFGRHATSYSRLCRSVSLRFNAISSIGAFIFGFSQLIFCLRHRQGDSWRRAGNRRSLGRCKRSWFGMDASLTGSLPYLGSGAARQMMRSLAEAGSACKIRERDLLRIQLPWLQHTKNLLLAGTLALFALALFAYSIISIINRRPSRDCRREKQSQHVLGQTHRVSGARDVRFGSRWCRSTTSFASGRAQRQGQGRSDRFRGVRSGWEREITLEFITSLNEGMPLAFRAEGANSRFIPGSTTPSIFTPRT